MKKYIVAAGLFLLMNSCLNNDFMEVYPKDQQTELTSFRSYENFKTYSWGLYNVFFGYAYKTGQTDEIFKGDYEADNMIKHVSGNESQWAYQKAKVPASSDSWDYEYIRRVNLMLDNIDQSSMNDAEKAHWRSVGYFFRAYKYFKMLSLYGDLPWVEHTLSEDSEELYLPRDPRDVVAQNILNNLKYAEEHIKVDGDGNNTINRAVVQSLISRFCLFEGTWRKYHALPNATTYLEECTRASKEVMNKYTTLHPNYEELFNSESLAGINGIILYKEYATSQLCHGLTRMVRTGESQIEATKDAVDSYLCSDGHPIKNSTTYGGDKDVYAQFRNRDYRLYHTVCPPYMVSLASASTTQWKFTDNPSEREYIDLMDGEAVADRLTNTCEAEQQEQREAMERSLTRDEERIEVLDKMVMRLYEDMIAGRISEQNFNTMLEKTQTEQTELKTKVSEGRKRLSDEVQLANDAKQWVEAIQEYANITELDAATLNRLIKEIVVHERIDEDKTRHISIEIHFNLKPIPEVEQVTA